MFDGKILKQNHALNNNSHFYPAASLENLLSFVHMPKAENNGADQL